MHSTLVRLQVVSCAKFFLTVFTVEAERHVGLNVVPHGLFFCSAGRFAAKSARKLAVYGLDEILVNSCVGI